MTDHLRYYRNTEVSERDLEQGRLASSSWLVLCLTFTSWRPALGDVAYKESIHFASDKKEAETLAKFMSDAGWHARVIPPCSPSKQNFFIANGWVRDRVKKIKEMVRG